MIVTTKCGAALPSLHFRNPAFIDQSQTDIQTLIIFRFRFIIIRLLVGYIRFGRLISIWQTNAFLPTILRLTNKQLWQLRCQQGQGLYLTSIFLAARAALYLHMELTHSWLAFQITPKHPCRRLYQIRQPPTFLCTTSNFLI